MSNRTWQLAGLFGFMLSGGFFLVTGIAAGDILIILGCLCWIVGCVAWGIPLLRASEPGDH